MRTWTSSKTQPPEATPRKLRAYQRRRKAAKPFSSSRRCNLYFTQRLILQPRLEASVATRAYEERGLGWRLRNLEAGLRLRYGIRREIAPYIGVTWSRSFGDTADLVRRSGGGVSSTALVAGVRVWY